MNAKPDIAKCNGTKCAFKEACGRFLRPAGDNQVWNDFDVKATDDCGHFEPVQMVGKPIGESA